MLGDSLAASQMDLLVQSVGCMMESMNSGVK